MVGPRQKRGGGRRDAAIPRFDTQNKETPPPCTHTKKQTNKRHTLRARSSEMTATEAIGSERLPSTNSLSPTATGSHSSGAAAVAAIAAPKVSVSRSPAVVAASGGRV